MTDWFDGQLYKRFDYQKFWRSDAEVGRARFTRIETVHGDQTAVVPRVDVEIRTVSPFPKFAYKEIGESEFDREVRERNGVHQDMIDNL